MDRIKELELISERLEIATRAARIAIWEWDYSKDELYWSPVFLEILGLEPNDFKGQLEDFMDRLVPEDVDRVQRALQAHLEENVPYELEYEMRHRDGQRIRIAATGRATFGEDGGVKRMVGTVQDVSERRALEDKLLRAERIGKIGHWELDVATSRLTWSPETFRIHGLEPESAQPTVEEAFGFYHPDDIEAVAKNFEEVFETGQLRGVNARLKLENGEIRHVYADGISYMKDEEGRPLRIFGILHDRTEFVKKEEQLKESQRLEAVGQLAGGIAHDFNNLLAVIHGNLELLQDDEKSHDMSKKERLDTISSAIAAARSGADLTRNMLTFASKSQLAPQRVAVNDLIAETESWLLRTIPSSIDVTTKLLADQQYCTLDPAGFQSAIVNVVVNARDAMSEGGRLTIETHNVVLDDVDNLAATSEEMKTGPYIVVLVTDTGVGIDRDLLSRVFEPFVTTKAMATGTGLGLSMVQGFVRQSGGMVEIVSDKGVGTSVKMFFPLAWSETEVTKKATAANGHEKSNYAGARILIAEDQPEVLALLVRTFKSAGYRIEAAANGDQALKLFHANGPFDVLVTDIVMPGDLSGPQLASACREHAANLPVVFLTGYSSGGIAQMNNPHDDDLCLMKPVPKSELLRAVGSVLS